MKSTGIVRKVDELGRIVLPIELRRTLDIAERDSLEIYVDGPSIVLRKYSQPVFSVMTPKMSSTTRGRTSAPTASRLCSKKSNPTLKLTAAGGPVAVCCCAEKNVKKLLHNRRYGCMIIKEGLYPFLYGLL